MAQCTLESDKYYFSRDVQKPQVQSLCKHLLGSFKLGFELTKEELQEV